MPKVDFAKPTCKIRRELHASGFGPMVCSCPQTTVDVIKSMNFSAARTHDWALINPGERVWSGPGSHNGIDSAVFTLETLAKFQTSKYDQAYYYGCRHQGSWGYKDFQHQKYKTYYALKMFGDIVSQYSQLVETQTSVRWVTPFAGRSVDGKKGFVFICDYGGRSDVVVDVAGVSQPKNVCAIVLDYTRNLAPVDVKWNDGRLILPRKDSNSIAFLVTFDF